MRKDRLMKTKADQSRSLISMKKAQRRWAVCLLLCASLLLGTEEALIERVHGQQRAIIISSSPLTGLLRERLEKQPGITDEALADYANALLSRTGFDYQFDVCEFLRLIPQKNAAQTPSRYRFQMTQVDGRRLTLQIGGDAVSDGMCGECFFALPSLGVKKAEIVLLIKERRYRLKRPRLFGLDEMSLVDGSMKRVLRTWEVPYQSIPLGISPDGTRLYIETEFDRLALEIAPSGISFKARSRVEIQNGQEITGRPRDPDNAYLGFMRFRSAKRSYIVRYSAPCT
jgi:hypothetical protein